MRKPSLLEGEILLLLEDNKEHTTYGIQKEFGISWSAVQACCFMLLSIGLIQHRILKPHSNQIKHLWRRK